MALHLRADDASDHGLSFGNLQMCRLATQPCGVRQVLFDFFPLQLCQRPRKSQVRLLVRHRVMFDVQLLDRDGIMAFSQAAETDCANVIGSFR